MERNSDEVFQDITRKKNLNQVKAYIQSIESIFLRVSALRVIKRCFMIKAAV